ncbi:MAG: flagellar biosynthetic protein FliR [Clostridia bacterium]|nr:flagellar biosynthetic protein FliR [Clostridia bacterium]
MTLSVANIDLFLLVFMRMSGAVLFNPILGRNNIPYTLKAALSLIVSFLCIPLLDASKVATGSIVALAVCCVTELAVGLALGVLISGLFSVVLVAGELIDQQMGFSMATFYDPNSGVNMPVVGSLFNTLLLLTFFASNAHLTFFRLVSDSYKAIPPGTAMLTTKSMQFVVMMGGDIFEMGLRLALPILAVELIVQLASGILMRAVPQINVFTAGIQLQAVVGIVMLVLILPIIMTLCGRLTDYMIEKCVEVLKMMIPST